MGGQRGVLHDGRFGFVPGSEGGSVRVQRPHLGLRQRGKNRAAARGEVAGQPDPDVGHQRRPVLGPLFHDVEHVAAVQHSQMRAFANHVHERGEHRPAQPGQRLLPRIGRAEFEGADAQAVALLLMQMEHEAVRFHHSEQVVDAGARQPQRGGNVRRRHRSAPGGQQLEDAQGVLGGRDFRRRPGAGGSADRGGSRCRLGRRGAGRGSGSGSGRIRCRGLVGQGGAAGWHASSSRSGGVRYPVLKNAPAGRVAVGHSAPPVSGIPDTCKADVGLLLGRLPRQGSKPRVPVAGAGAFSQMTVGQ
ncbi:hypothetical protein SRABI26_02240 [Arthrobacter sp. Bi26]|nr:hypothetical protein SRABI26_02240 [Arthrobacter sp. Bi26]